MSLQNIQSLKTMSLEDVLKAIDKQEISDAVIVTYALDNAFTNFQINISANFFGCVKATDVNTNADIEFNKIGTGKVNFSQGLYFNRPTNRVFMTSSAQTGKSISFIYSSYAPELFGIQDNRSAQLQAASLATIATNTNELLSTGGIAKNTRTLNGDTGTQVIKSINSVSNTTTVLYTVTAGKTLYMTSFSLCISEVNQTGIGSLFVTDASDVTQFTISQIGIDPTGATVSQNPCDCRSPSMPLKISAGWKIKVSSTVGNVYANAAFTGWEE